MIDLLIKLLIVLGLQYGITESGQISMSEADLQTLTSSQVYKDNGSPSVSEVAVPNIDPDAKEVAVPNIDPVHEE